MLKVVLIAAAVVAVLLIVLVAVIATRPSEFHVERTATVNAVPEAVFAQVNDFHKWEPWNPWGKLDPAMKNTYEGAPMGEGAIYSWAGDKNVGEGRMTIVESQPHQRIQIQLEFFKPMAGTSTAEFTFKPEGDRTSVTWSMHGKNDFMGKAISLVMDMDKMIGGNFEKGLAGLKSIAESASAGTAPAIAGSQGTEA
ncbi:MAG: SRPBCC family protein [Candidatus Hydrogenedentes bacterium]|nr:SRPBCC family protein [Candidatus Hydrogenedentota bacterium]